MLELIFNHILSNLCSYLGKWWLELWIDNIKSSSSMLSLKWPSKLVVTIHCLNLSMISLTEKYSFWRRQRSLKLNLFMYRARRENLYKFTNENNDKSVKIFAPRRVCGHVTSLILFTCIKSILVTTAKWRKNMVWIGLYLLSLKIGSQLMKWFQKLFLFFFSLCRILFKNVWFSPHKSRASANDNF